MLDRACTNAHASTSACLALAPGRHHSHAHRVLRPVGASKRQGGITTASNTRASTPLPERSAPIHADRPDAGGIREDGVIQAEPVDSEASSPLGQQQQLGGDRAWHEGWSLVADFSDSGNTGDLYSWCEGILFCLAWSPLVR